MNAIILASRPYKPPPLPLDLGWARMTHTLIGWNGAKFEISDPGSGVFLTHGVRGMKNPPFKHFRDARASLPGSQWRGYVEETRDCFWPIYIYSDESSKEWIQRYRAFWDALSPAQESVWEVRSETFGTRRLRVRLEPDTDPDYELDPLYMGWAVYGINLSADQPMWEGDDIVRPFAAPASFNFTGDTGGPPFFVAPYMDADSAVLSNPGNIESHLRWTVEGPQPSGVTLGFGTSSIEVPFALTTGQTLTVDTRPEWRTAILQDGTDRTDELINPSWEALLPGKDIPLNISLSGTGMVTARLTPLYWRAM